MAGARPLSFDEVHAIVLNVDNLRDKLFMLMGRFTGFRVKELLSLTVGHVWRNDAPVPEISLSRRFLKGGRGAAKRGLTTRTVPVHPSLAAEIQTYLHFRYGTLPPAPGEPLFVSPRLPHRAISRVQAFRIIKHAAAETTDATRVSPHSLRKAFAQEIYAASHGDLMLVQAALGHRSPLTTAAYLSADESKVRLAVMGMRNFFPAPPAAASPTVAPALRGA